MRPILDRGERTRPHIRNRRRQTGTQEPAGRAVWPAAERLFEWRSRERPGAEHGRLADHAGPARAGRGLPGRIGAVQEPRGPPGRRRRPARGRHRQGARHQPVPGRRVRAAGGGRRAGPRQGRARAGAGGPRPAAAGGAGRRAGGERPQLVAVVAGGGRPGHLARDRGVAGGGVAGGGGAAGRPGRRPAGGVHRARCPGRPGGAGAGAGRDRGGVGGARRRRRAAADAGQAAAGKRPTAGRGPPGPGAAGAPVARPGGALMAARAVVQRGGYRDLLLGQAVSAFGDWMGTVALMALVLDLTGSATAVGVILVLRLLPAGFAGPIAAGVAERWDRRRIMLACDLVRAGLVALIPLVRAAWWVYLWAFLLEVANLVFLPARDASVPDLVGDEQELPAANGIILGSSYGNIPIGAAAFALLTLVPTGWNGYLGSHPSALPLWLDGLTYLVSFAFIRRLEVLGPASTEGQLDEEGRE